MRHDPHLPREVEVVERIDDGSTVFSLGLQFTGGGHENDYRFRPGQFNMLYLHGVGEVPISIVSSGEAPLRLIHTLRGVGRVTRGLEKLAVGDRLGLRGPFGSSWPLDSAKGKDILILTGGLGCAPVVAVIHHVMARRDDYGHVTIMQGVKHSDDLIWREQYAAWAAMEDTTVLLATDVAGANWPWHVGRVTVLLEHAEIDGPGTLAMMCGPEIMMRSAAPRLLERGIAADALWLSMERNMQCALGQCGHCQFGARFVCRDGPVFPFPAVRDLFGQAGF